MCEISPVCPSCGADVGTGVIDEQGCPGCGYSLDSTNNDHSLEDESEFVVDGEPVYGEEFLFSYELSDELGSEEASNSN